MKLWKNNHKDEEYELSEEVIAEAYLSDPIDTEDWGRPTDIKLRCFLSAKEYLSSAWDCETVVGITAFNKVLDLILEAHAKRRGE